MKKVRLLAALAVLTLGVATGGTISSVNTRVALGANDLVEWGLVTDDGTFPTSPYDVVSAGGINLSATASALAIFVQNGSGGYVGAFTPGDILLDSGLTPGPITIDFATAVRGVGFHISSLNFGAFTGTVEFFGAGNVLFGTVNVNGTSSSNNDGSAPFLGGVSSARDITRVVISTTGAGSELTINQMSLLTTDAPGGDVPEPSTMTLFSAAIVGCAWLRRRRA